MDDMPAKKKTEEEQKKMLEEYQKSVSADDSIFDKFKKAFTR